MRRVRWGLAALAWMGFIFWLSAQPDLPRAPEPWLDKVVKKSGHVVLYGVLAWLYLGALRGNGLLSHRMRLLAFGLAVLYGVTDEVHQSFVPGRTPSPVDVFIDGVGAALGSGFRGVELRAICPHRLPGPVRVPRPQEHASQPGQPEHPDRQA